MVWSDSFYTFLYICKMQCACVLALLSCKRSLQVTGGIPEGPTMLIGNIYAESACSERWKEVGFCGCAVHRVQFYGKRLVTLSSYSL